MRFIKRLGNHHTAVEYLSRVMEDEHYDEAHRTSPSPQLRRYVSMLRYIEYHPATAPQTLAAFRSLERARERNAAKLLLESQKTIETEQHRAPAEKPAPAAKETREEMTFSPSMPLSSISAPPSISKVLHDVYQDETGASN